MEDETPITFEVVRKARRITEDAEFEELSPEEIAGVIEWLAEGMARDYCTRFEGYRGAAAALRMARVYVERYDTPEAIEEALVELGNFADDALGAPYWTADGEFMEVAPDDAEERWQPTVKALIAASRCSRAVRARLA